MIAMQTMMDAVIKYNMDKVNVQPPTIDNEVNCNKDLEDGKVQLTVLAQDRNEWDDIYDQFQDISFEKLDKAINRLKSDQSKNIYKKLSQLINTSNSYLERNDLLHSVLTIVYNYSLMDLQKELLDFLGEENIELISFLVEHRDQIVAAPLDHTILMVNDSSNLLMTDDEIQEQVRENARKAKNTKLAKADKIIKYPHVFRKYESNTTSALSFSGQKFTLPVGTTRTSLQTHEEIIIPAADPEKNKNFLYTKLKKISELDRYCKSVFKYETLNQIQTLVYPVAYTTNENMLICAPTGAGKTDIALLTILNTIKQYSMINEEDEIDIQYDDFKIIYVAPLKALAS